MLYAVDVHVTHTYTQAKDLLVRDAFMAFNSSHSGALTCSELYGGLLWLGMRVDPPLIHDIVRTVDLDCDGYVSWPEFKKAFSSTSTKTTVRADGTIDEIDEQDTDILELGSNSDRSQWPAAFDDTDANNSSAFTVPPKAMPELYEIYNANRKRDAATVETVEEMKAERLEAFKVKVQKQDKVEW
jgi:EF-hand domain pair